MTLPYCCHIISQIEIEYDSSADLPRWLIQAFKNPRIVNTNGSFKHRINHSAKTTSLDELYSICDSFLQNYGYSMKYLSNYDANSSCPPLPLPDYNSQITPDTQKNDNTCPADSDSNDETTKCYNFKDLEVDGIAKQIVQNIATKSMVYYLSLYEEFSKNYDLLNISKKSIAISKNSTYEMISGLRDCLAHLYASAENSKEAIIITNEYSGIFSGSDILITRSNMTFRENLQSNGIEYATIYDEIQSYANSPLVKISDKDFSGIVNSYLTNEFKETHPKRRHYDPDFGFESFGKKNVSKFYLLKALKLPMSEDYDINVVRIRGKSNCHKLFKFLDKNCMNSLLALKNDKYSNVRLILTNFPMIFSKVNQARFSTTNDRGRTKIAIKGLIMPSALMCCFDVVKILESSGIAAKPIIKLTYNTTFDNEMYEKTLRIHENRIYEQFLRHFVEIRREFRHAYRALKKLVPFSKFTLHKGRVTVAPSATPFLSRTGDVILSIENKKIASARSELAIMESLTPDVVIVKDTLYHSLARVKLYLMNIQGTRNIMKYSTKRLLDEAFNRVSHCSLGDTGLGDKARSYVYLYPNNTPSPANKEGTSQDSEASSEHSSKQDDAEAVMARVFPDRLTNIIWTLSYLLHSASRLEFYDKKALDNIMNYDIHTLGVKDSQLDWPVDGAKPNASNSLNFPLAQQSYIVHVANHINFNRSFYRTLKTKYLDFLKNSNVNVKVYEPEKIQVLDQVLKLSSGWKSYFKAKGRRPVFMSDDETSGDENTSDKDSSNTGQNDSSGDSNDTKPTANQQTVMNGEPDSGPRLGRIVYDLDNSKPINNDVNSDFGTVHVSSRKNGRVHQCSFDFDASSTFEDMCYSDNYNIIDKLSSAIAREHTTQPLEANHTVLVFMFSNEPSLLECVHLKLIKDVLNSNLVKFSTHEPTFQGLDLKHLNISNANKFERAFTKNDFASGSTILVKNSVSYSLMSSDETLSGFRSAFKQIRIVAIPLMADSSHSFSKSSVKMIRVFNDVNKEFRASLDFVDPAWIFDGYAQGILDLDDIPDEYALQQALENPTQYSLEDFSIQDFKEDTSSQLRLTIDDLNEYTISQMKLSQDTNLETMTQFESTGSTKQELRLNSSDTLQQDLGESREWDGSGLAFRESYKQTKHLWGWTVYLVGTGPWISQNDCTLYRKHCGVKIVQLSSREEIKEHVEKATMDALSKFNITEQDVAEFLTQDRIFINSVAITTEPAGLNGQATHPEMALPMLAGKKICFGGYQGIPVLSHKWFVEAMRSPPQASMC